jgi:hypothetical protein
VGDKSLAGHDVWNSYFNCKDFIISNVRMLSFMVMLL